MIRTLLLTLAFCGAALPGAAQISDVVVEAELLTGWREPGGRHLAGLRLRLAPGWKTYWRAPGEGGIPPQFDWTGSTNLSSATPRWPVPEVFERSGLRSIGYVGGLVLPLELRPKRPDQAIALDGIVTLGVCDEICIPVTLNLSATLPVAAGSGRSEISAALADRPLTGAEAGLNGVRCAFAPIADGMRASISVDMPRLGPAETAVVEFADPGVWVSDAVSRRGGRRLEAEADLVPGAQAPFAVSREDVRITVLADGRAVDIRGCGAG